LEAILKANKTIMAAIIVTPWHPLAAPVEMPKPDTWKAFALWRINMERFWLFDEIRSGFRVSLGGGKNTLG
jgi:glutamate-1-semialdehyde aminotransferase